MDKVELIVRASALHDPEKLARLKARLLSQIETAGGFTVKEVSAPSGKQLVAVLVLTGGVEREVLKLIPQLPTPILLIAHPGHNSLPASLELLARIHQDGGEGEILFGSPTDIAAGLSRELRVISAWNKLRFSRIGLIGPPAEWLVASEVDPAFLKGQLSIEPIKIKIEELIEHIESSPEPRRELRQFIREATEVDGPSKNELRIAGTIYTGLRSLIEERRLSCCTVSCFELISRLQNTACYAISRLNDEGIPTGCEGDLQALFSLYLGMLISGKPCFMGNISSIDQTMRRVTLSHCSCPLSLATEYTIRSHFESGVGVGIGATIPEGEATLLRLGGRRLNQLSVRQGEIEKTRLREGLCRTQVTLSLSEPLDRLLTAPLGNHHILIPGGHQRTIERFFNRFLSP